MGDLISRQAVIEILEMFTARHGRPHVRGYLDRIVEKINSLPTHEATKSTLQQEQICRINKTGCVGYSNGKCISIENCYGKDWRDTSE